MHWLFHFGPSSLFFIFLPPFLALEMLDCRRPWLRARIHKAGGCATTASGHTVSALVRSHIRARISRIRRRRRHRIVRAIVVPPSFFEQLEPHTAGVTAAASLSSRCRARPPSVLRDGNRGQPRRASVFRDDSISKAARAAI